MAKDPALTPVTNLSKLAREIAMDVFELGEIQEAHKLTDDQWTTILANPDFQRMLSEMIVDWRSASGTRERIKIKSQTAVEALLDGIYHDITDRSIPFTQRVDGFKMLAKLGDLGERDAIVAGGGGSVQININLGVPGAGIDQMVTIENEPLEVTQ